jgi:hypothetical protein
MAKHEKNPERAFEPEFIRNLGARAITLSNVEVLQQVNSTLYDTMHGVFSKRKVSATPDRLGLTLEFADALLTQGRRVAGELSKQAPGLQTQTEFGPAFLSLRAGLLYRLGDVAVDIREEMALSTTLFEVFATVAENPRAAGFIEEIGMRDRWQGSLVTVEDIVQAQESHSN